MVKQGHFFWNMNLYNLTLTRCCSSADSLRFIFVTVKNVWSQMLPAEHHRPLRQKVSGFVLFLASSAITGIFRRETDCRAHSFWSAFNSIFSHYELLVGWALKHFPHWILSAFAETIGKSLYKTFSLLRQNFLSLHVFLFLMQDYEPTIYHPKRSSHSLHQDFTIQCEKMDIPFLSYLPTEVGNFLTEHILQALQPCHAKRLSMSN